jgi:hypothetical protein
MERQRRAWRTAAVTAIAALAVLGGLGRPAPVRAAADTLPERLSGQEFWTLSQTLSEPNGFFRSDNLVSNEIWFQWVIPELLTRSREGSVYLGVGPEQNFTYIAALKPKMVFITDVRRGNLHMHLMYKALFELSADRAEFVSRLFTKRRPQGLTAKSTATEVINAFWDVPTSAESVYKENLKAIEDHLTKTRGLPLGKDDLDGIEYCYWSFYWYGPRINYSSSSNSNGRGNFVTWGDLMIAADAAGLSRSFLASEDTFNVLKDLHQRNLIVPVVGNFAGPKALRAVGRYVREHGATIAAMYLSNVEQYLVQDGIWNAFCGNVASMPLDDKSTFIRSASQGGGGPGGGLVNSLGSMQNETRGCAPPGRPALARVKSVQ